MTEQITYKREVHKALVEARELLARPYGWIKGSYKREREIKGNVITGYCLSGAVRQVTYFDAARSFSFSNRQYERRVSVAASASRFFREINGRDMVALNDDRKTRKKDVLAALDRCIQASAA